MFKLTKTQRKAMRRLKEEQKRWHIEEAMQRGAAKILGLISSYKPRAVVEFQEYKDTNVLDLVNKFTGKWHCVDLNYVADINRVDECRKNLNNGGGVSPWNTDTMKVIFNSHSYKSGLHSWA